MNKCIFWFYGKQIQRTAKHIKGLQFYKVAKMCWVLQGDNVSYLTIKLISTVQAH